MLQSPPKTTCTTLQTWRGMDKLSHLVFVVGVHCPVTKSTSTIVQNLKTERQTVFM